MKEIGGYFEFEQLIKNEYYKNLIGINTGRNALIYLIKAKNIEKIYIPYYLCESVYEILDKYNYKYEFYYIDNNFLPILEKKLEENEYLYIVNYYGQLSNERVIKLKEKYKNIILDNTHAFFQQPINEIDIIYNCRKWFGVPDGAYLSTTTVLKENLEKDFSKERMKHLLGRYEEKASKYYDDFKKNDDEFKNLKLKYMSDLTHNLLGAIDYEKVRVIRNSNYLFLEKNLKNINQLKIVKSEVPFCYPLYIKNSEYLRKKLIEKKIYIPILWPNVLNENDKNTIEYDYTQNILPIPCDQRYNLEDLNKIINFIVEEIDEFKK